MHVCMRQSILCPAYSPDSQCDSIYPVSHGPDITTQGERTGKALVRGAGLDEAGAAQDGVALQQAVALERGAGRHARHAHARRAQPRLLLRQCSGNHVRYCNRMAPGKRWQATPHLHKLLILRWACSAEPIIASPGNNAARYP